MTIGCGWVFAFPIDARHKRMVIEGIDMIGLTLAALDDIEAFEREHPSPKSLGDRRIRSLG